MKPLDYCDLKNAIVTLEDRIKDTETELQINKLVLNAFQEAIKKIPPPIKKPF